MKDDYLFNAQIHGAKINVEASQSNADRKETTLSEKQRNKSLKLVEEEIKRGK